jgi:hypothetical protein
MKRMISQIVGRCHVGDSHRKVLRYFKSRLNLNGWNTIERKERKRILRLVIVEHDANRALYAKVMRGGF